MDDFAIADMERPLLENELPYEAMNFHCGYDNIIPAFFINRPHTRNMAKYSMESKTTTDHETIKQWIQGRGGKPAIVKGTQYKGSGAGLLRIDFGDNNDSLQDISWKDFFNTFEQKKLAFIYQERTGDGEESRFFKFVER